MSNTAETANALTNLRANTGFVAVVAAINGGVLAGLAALVVAFTPLPVVVIPVAAVLGAAGYLRAIRS